MSKDNFTANGGIGQPPREAQRRIVATYDYVDTGGQLVYQVVRYAPKTFRPRRPHPTKPEQWCWNLDGVGRVPYQLPKLLAESCRVVYIVEGEKDADNLNRFFEDCGVTDSVATTSVGGAGQVGQWPAILLKYPQLATEKRVVAIPDRDALAGKAHDAGLKFGRAVCKAFHDAGCDIIEMVELPVKDISDLIELRRGEGRTPDEIYQELEMLCEQAEPVTGDVIAMWEADKVAADTPAVESKQGQAGASATQNGKGETRRAVIIPFSEIRERETEWLWDNKIPAGELCLLSGLAGQGKTFWTCYLAAMVSNGWNWPDGTPCPQGNVLFFRGEDSIEKTVKRRLSANGADMSKVVLLDRCADDSVLTLHDVDVIRDAMRQSQERNALPVRLIVIDPMADYLGDTKENSNCEVRNVLKQLKAIAEETGVTFLLVQHIGKTDRESVQQRVLGSTGIVASCRASFCLFYDKENGHRTFAPMKNNLAVDPTSIVFLVDPSVKGGQVQIIDWMLEKTADDIAGEIREAYQQGKGGRKPKESTDAENWLYDFLSDGHKPVGNKNNPALGSVRCESDQAGHSWRSVERAKKSLGAVSKKDCGVWFWSLSNLPNSTDQDRQNTKQDRQDRQNSNDANNGNEKQDHEFDGETGEGRQNDVCTENSGGLAQNAGFESTGMNTVLDSKPGDSQDDEADSGGQEHSTVTDLSTHNPASVPLQRTPKPICFEIQ